MRRILVIEDEEALRHGMVRALGKLNAVAVRGTGTLAEALVAIDDAPPDLVISDLDLPDRFGGELLGELEQRGLRIPVTFVSAHLRRLAARVPESSIVSLVEKPVAIDRLRELASAALSRKDSSLPPPFGVADYLQIACLGRHSVVITCRRDRDDGAATARLVVWRGELWDATDEVGEGLAAFRRLVTRPGVFRAHSLDREPGPRTIEGPWEMLMLDALRLADEEALRRTEEHAQREGDAEPALTPSPDEPALDPYDDAFERGVDALLRRDHAAAGRAFVDALRARPGDPKASANLERLRTLGLVSDFDDGSGRGGIR